MELLQLNGKSAGADDFFPLLVFVILKANPANLLATIQVRIDLAPSTSSEPPSLGRIRLLFRVRARVPLRSSARSILLG